MDRLDTIYERFVLDEDSLNVNSQVLHKSPHHRSGPVAVRSSLIAYAVYTQAHWRARSHFDFRPSTPCPWPYVNVFRPHTRIEFENHVAISIHSSRETTKR